MGKKTHQFQKNDRIRLTITDMGIGGEGIGRIRFSDESPVNRNLEKTDISEKVHIGVSDSRESACGKHAAEVSQNAGPNQAEPDGPVFFVKNAVIGDEVLAVITRMKKGYGYAKVLEILNPSPYRVRPVCPLAERCGGCQIMQLSYDAQLRFKEDKVRSDLERIGGQHCEAFYPIIGMEQAQPVHYRNKMQFPVGWDKEGHVVTGFYAGRTHYIVSAPDCPISPQVNGILLETVREFLEKHRISTYHEETGTGLVRHVLIRNGFGSGQIMICLVINGDRLEQENRMFSPVNGISARMGGTEAEPATDLESEFVTALTTQTLPEPWRIASICLNSNKEQTNVILGETVRCIYGPPFLEDTIVSRQDDMRPLTFRIDPKSFFQTNPEQTVRLYDTVLEMAGLTGTETVWDLYCGIGTISLFLAQKAKKVFGVEIVPEAIENARENAKRNGIVNAEFFCGKSEKVFPDNVCPDSKQQMNRNQEAESDNPGLRPKPADIVVLDPPRKGCDPELLEAILKVSPGRIVYVSCDPATLARDVKILCEAGYRLEKVQPVDMFPHTVHVETCCLLGRKDVNKRSYVSLDVEMDDYYRIKESKGGEADG